MTCLTLLGATNADLALAVLVGLLIGLAMGILLAAGLLTND